ncbi:MAG TPA: serine/threonine-protein kinase, partial [Minicystis sp.]|nr:serine/threonine-protein kinase [Minicystis sp.]
MSAFERESSSGMHRRDPGEDETFFVGRYRVISEIGRGGMASVHLSRIDGPGGFHKWVAIKRIHPHLVENDQLVDMFLDEARMAAGISHPNVAQVFDIGKDKDTYWIAMEYLHGEPLRELLRYAEEHDRPVMPEIAARIVADAAEGLHAAHELRGKNGELLNLVHRDVTPHNLFVTYDGYTKVVDFGIAKAAGRLASTNAGELKGKIAYMAPEQIKNQELDRRTDVFALGIVLWELTTNQRLFRMETDLETLEKVQACEIPPPSRLVPGYPHQLEEIVLTALAREKEDRYQTARAFSRALQTFLRRHTFVGFEEVGELMKRTFGDRLARRNDHLAWATEVTGTMPPEGRAVRGDEPDPPTLEEDDDRAEPTLQKRLAAKAKQHGLMEDDDDAATLIARNPSSFIAAALAPAREPARAPMHSDATQLLPLEERGAPTVNDASRPNAPRLPQPGRLPKTEPPPPPRARPSSKPPSRPPPLSHRGPLPRLPAPSSTTGLGPIARQKGEMPPIPRAPAVPNVALADGHGSAAT